MSTAYEPDDVPTPPDRTRLDTTADQIAPGDRVLVPIGAGWYGPTVATAHHAGGRVTYTTINGGRRTLDALDPVTVARLPGPEPDAIPHADEARCRLCRAPIFRLTPFHDRTEDADTWTTDENVLAGGICPAGGGDYACHEPEARP